MAGFGDQITAERVDLMRHLAHVELFADSGADVFETGAARGQERAVGLPRHRGTLLFVMLVGDIANDQFDQILHRHQPIAAAVFVDNQCKMNAGRLHFRQQIERRH